MNHLKTSMEKVLMERKPVNCEMCGEKVYYLDGGKYQCRSCGHIMLDDFGKVKEYINEYGPSPSVVIAAATGVDKEMIDAFLRKGRLEIPEGSRYYIPCQKCHCSIRYGRFCPDCIKDIAGEFQTAFWEDVGEKPKPEYNPNIKAKIHFFHKQLK